MMSPVVRQMASVARRQTVPCRQLLLPRRARPLSTTPVAHKKAVADDRFDPVRLTVDTPFTSLLQDAEEKHYKDTLYLTYLEQLQQELTKMHDYVRRTGKKVVIVFEGRDAAGKGGCIKRMSHALCGKSHKVVALNAPTEQDKSRWYFQRYVSHLPAAGEIVLFDRSWYNRAGVEYVNGWCTDQQYDDFLDFVPAFEQSLIRDDIILIKLFLEITYEEQVKRFKKRAETPHKRSKLSEHDLRSVHLWDEYTNAFSTMVHTTSATEPWVIVPADDKRSCRLNVISHILKCVPYDGGKQPKKALKKIKLPRVKRGKSKENLLSSPKGTLSDYVVDSMYTKDCLRVPRKGDSDAEISAL